METSIPTKQPYGFNWRDELFTASDNGTQFGLSSESHLANTLLHPTSKAIWKLYWGMCHPGDTKPANCEGQHNPALLSPLSLCTRHLIQRSPQHTHLLYSTVLSSASESSRRNQSKALINHPPQDTSCSRICAKYWFILGLTILSPTMSRELHFLFKCS